MKIEVNGEFRNIEEGGTVRELVRVLGYDPRGMAVALDGEVVSRSEWDSTRLVEGQRIEIVRAVQGG